MKLKAGSFSAKVRLHGRRTRYGHRPIEGSGSLIGFSGLFFVLTEGIRCSFRFHSYYRLVKPEFPNMPGSIGSSVSFARSIRISWQCQVARKGS